MNDWLKARKQAASRRRRVIFNNDGDDVFLAEKATPESFLAARTTGIEGKHVDTYVYSTLSNFNSCVHDSRVAEVNRVVEPFFFPRNNVQALIDQGHDSLSLIIGFCREKGLEVFWGVRMNDVHDNWYPSMWTEFKKNRPDLMLWREGDYGRPGDGKVEPSMHFTAMDFGQEEIRQRVYDTIGDVCERYDVDGVELDFLRNPMYFRPNMEGRSVEEQHVTMMTDLVRRVRNMADEVGQRKGKPILISARVPNLLMCCRYIGLDVERWMNERLIDFVIPSIEFCPFTGDVKEMVTLAHSHDMPAYACLSGSAGLAGWPAASMNALADGADGIATFNDFAPLNPIWEIIGDPAIIQETDRTYEVDLLDLPRVRMHEHVVDLQGRLPIALTLGSSTQITLPVGEDLASKKGEIDMTLLVAMERCAYGDKFEFRMNGRPLEHIVHYNTDGCAPLAVGKIAFTAKVDPAAMLEGDNQVGIKVTRIQPREAASTVVEMKLYVKMRKGK